MSPLWRAPYGSFNFELVGYASELGYTHVHWTLDTHDWVADPGAATQESPYRSARWIRNLVLRHAKDGDIVLMHLYSLRRVDHPWEVLPEIVAGLRRKAFDLVTVSELRARHAQGLPILPPWRSNATDIIGGEAQDNARLPSPMGPRPAVTPSPGRLISVIIPTYNRPLALRRCIASLAQQEYPPESFEVVVVDDGSDPPPAENLSGELPGHIQVSLLREPHRGVAAARAAGIARARGRILAFLDDDCTVPPDYLGAIARVFETHPETQVVQVSLHNPEPGNIYGRAWKFTWDENLEANLVATPGGRLKCGNLGGVMVARRDVFTEVAFEATLDRAREDADLLYQLRLRDIPVYYESQVRVFHHCRETLGSYLAQYFGYGRGEFHLRRKWGPVPPPARYVTLVSWQQLRALLKAEGVPSGVAIYCVFWLKSHAGLWGISYETAAMEFPQSRILRCTRLSWLLMRLYAGLAAKLCRALRRRGLATLRSSAQKPVGCDN
jgi:glycosyltransferase involved in cell wall biosynthesis